MIYIVKENRSWIDESHALSNSASSYSLIKNLVSSLSRPATTSISDDNLRDYGNSDNNNTSCLTSKYQYPTEDSSSTHLLPNPNPHSSSSNPSSNPAYPTIS